MSEIGAAGGYRDWTVFLDVVVIEEDLVDAHFLLLDLLAVNLAQLLQDAAHSLLLQRNAELFEMSVNVKYPYLMTSWPLLDRCRCAT